MKHFERVVPDTNILIEAVLSDKVQKDWKIDSVFIHHAVLAELEHQANMGRSIGFIGLDELKKLRELAGKGLFQLEYKGKRPTPMEIKHAAQGEIDALIRELAYDEDAMLLTVDKVQFHTAEARGVKVLYVEAKEMSVKKLKLEQFFDESTMSVHLKEAVFPYAKRGFPGKWDFVQLREKVLTQEEVRDIARELVEETKRRHDSYIELERAGSTIIQLGNFRIVITRPPLSDGWEITAVRPVKKLTLDEYHMSEKLMQRLEKQAEGILVAGAPGMGKCHGKDTPILMFDGSIKMVQDVVAGEIVMGPDSKPRTVLGTNKGFGSLFKVIPVKGESYIVNEEHILSLKYNNHQVEKTMNISVKNFLKLSEYQRGRFKGYRTNINFLKKEVPINPYFLGLWLGDGLSASVRIANSEPIIIEYLEDYAQENGLVMRQHSYKVGICQTYGITTGQRGGIVSNSNKLLNMMRTLELINNKHVPAVYKINDEETRLQVLAGLIDTDGYLFANCFEIATKFERLREDILYLARSLGFAAYYIEKIVKDKKYYRIRISGDISLIPTKLKRKQGHKRNQIKNVLRTGISVEPIGKGEYYGFQSDGDSLYCLGDFTVTHNSTYASALALFYADKGKIVKTIEAPRDLVLPENVTQYAISHGDAQEIHDILLLTRPDYTLFDEMRNTKDFLLFADLRLAGIGLAGVIHATNPIDAIQRFVGRIELGVIPHVIDTVIFIKNGQIGKVLSLEMTVKVPSGMTEADLARPIVTVHDFETGKLEFEIYSYGEETIVVPVMEERLFDPTRTLAAKQIEQEMLNHVDKVKVKVLANNKAEVYVPESDIARIIGKQGKSIEQIEKKLGFRIDVRDLSEAGGGDESEGGDSKKTVPYKIEESKRALVIRVDPHYAGESVDVYVDGHFLFTSTVSKMGDIKLHKKSKLGQTIVDDLNQHRKVEIRL